MSLIFGSLFSGIGGLDLGLERAGMTCRWQCEIDSYATRVLEKHWPHVKRYRDITKMSGEELERVDLICGGFPCQDVSVAGKRAGIHGKRTGLFFDLMRIVRLVRPRFVLMENVPGLLIGDGLGVVLGELAESGFDAEWDCIPARAVGAHHIRDRVFIVAYASCERMAQRCLENRRAKSALAMSQGSFPEADWRATYSERNRVGHGIPGQIHRGRALGNAVVPQVAEAIGRMIVEACA